VVLALPLAACGGTEKAANTNTTAATTQKPQPTSVQQVCDAQSWPRPVPQVVGVMFDDAYSGSLSCWENVKALAPDGHDVVDAPVKEATYRITDISPAPGTPTGRNDWLTLHVVPVDLPTAPLSFHPCDWVTADEAARFLGVQSTEVSPVGDESGSVEPFCTYRGGSLMVSSQLHLPASFPVDAQTEINMNMAAGHGSEVSGLPGRASCSNTESDGKKSTTLVVLLDGNRLYEVLGWEGESCDTLKQFAQAAIPRIGP
jgi:hypothetical protein